MKKARYLRNKQLSSLWSLNPAGRKDRIYRSTTVLTRLILASVFRIEKKGTENLPEKKGFVLLPKHQRWHDIPLLSCVIPAPLYYVAKYELFTNPLLGLILKSLGGIPLNRDKPLESRRSLQAVIKLLSAGEGVVVFPEGTYYRKKMGPGHVGMVRLILSKVKLPFVPVGINYSHKEMRTLVRVNFGKPSYASSSDSPEGFLDSMMREIAELSELG